MKLKLQPLIFFITLLLSLNFAYAASFYKVTEGVYRGPRPMPRDLVELKQIGVKTILNIDSDIESIRWERKIAGEMGFKYISIPLSGFWTPTDRDVNRILNLLADPIQYPIFLHCKYGQDRTGLIVGLFRVFHQDIDAEIAYEEMLEYGFHQVLIFLDQYFFDRIRFSSPLG